MKFSNRVQQVSPSVTLALSAKAKSLQKKGLDVKNLTAGEPNFNTPKHIKQAAIAAIEAGNSDFYTPALGIKELREAIAKVTNEQYKTNYTFDNVAVTVGGKFALFAIAQAIFDLDDEILIPLPYWVSYSEQVKLAGAKPVFVSPKEGQLKVNVAELEAKRTAKTRAVIINSPQNPSGAIYSRQELEAIGNWAVENNIWLIADDMYNKLVYNGNSFVSLFELSEKIRKQTILVNGFSKTYSMTGWRVGYVLANKELIAKLSAVVGHATGNLAAVSQYAALAALNSDQSCVEEMRQAYEQRLNEIYPLLNEIPGFTLHTKPEGAFYLFPDIRQALAKTGFADTTSFADALLEEEYVAVVPGEAFGMPGYIRLSYAASLSDLREAMVRLKRFVEKHSK
ncbi:pyridoxal phosphate-dependent aminotransferase [Ligilactobacillus apodemi]|uniref:Aminotransferase n=1 Tax=Ligilactobacillus apodemi DSM 16634 = JCM 16172 TaxID=1423724 RepID=A0A0R1U2J0_9LACO|nr:pyridoxal phosphate-dependent aminotransferase [Ligilactobacillus apodemi]KRL83915.1 aspartate aminotransferase [Ligilactobacillus apodemi DSM 16634 = JCM 16172]